jgi:hypothetical protein
MFDTSLNNRSERKGAPAPHVVIMPFAPAGEAEPNASALRALGLRIRRTIWSNINSDNSLNQQL